MNFILIPYRTPSFTSISSFKLPYLNQSVPNNCTVLNLIHSPAVRTWSPLRPAENLPATLITSWPSWTNSGSGFISALLCGRTK